MAKKAKAPATYEEAWAPEPPSGDAWTARPWVHPVRAPGAGSPGPQARAAHQPCRLRAAPGRDPIAILERAGGRPAARSRPAAARAHGGVAVRLLPGHPRGDGLRPRHDAPHGHHRAGQRRRALRQLRPVRLARAAPRVRCQRLRRDAAGSLGVGRQAARGEHRHRRSRQRLQRRPEPAPRRWPPCAPTASGWPRFAAMRLIDVWYSYITDDAIREAGRAVVRAAPRTRRAARQARGPLRQGARPRRAARREPADHGSSTAGASSSTIRPSSSTSTSPAAPTRCARSSRTTAPRWPRAAASSWSATASPTSPSRSWASAASGPAAS